MSVWGKPLLVAAPTGTVSGNTVKFTGNGEDVTSLTCTLLPYYKSGEGTPSIDNIRKIESFYSKTIYWTKGSTSSWTQAYWGLGNYVSGCIIDGVNNTATRTYYFMEFDGTESWSRQKGGTNSCFFRLVLSNAAISSSSAKAYTRGCSHFENNSITTGNTANGFYAYTSASTTNIYIQFRPNVSDSTITPYITTLAEWKQFLADQKTAGTPVQVYFQDPLQTIFQLTNPLNITTYNGYNYISMLHGDADVQNINVTYPKNRLFYLS